jgi:hypothetical protein
MYFHISVIVTYVSYMYFLRTSRMKKERSCSGGMFDFPPSSPNMNRRSKEKPHGTLSTTRLRYLHSTVAQLVDLTIFHIPGLDVKVSCFNVNEALHESLSER